MKTNVGAGPRLVLAAAVLLAGCTPAHTRVTTYLPTAVPAQAATVGGSCWTHSIAAPARADAWRCSIGNRIEDPCFEIAGHTELLCGANPAAPGEAHPLALQLALPLPREPIPASINARPWLIELTDGAVCRPFTGTRPIAADHKTGTFACSNGYTVVGHLDRQAPGRWMAHLGEFAPAGSGLPQISGEHAVAVKAVWE